MNSQVMTAKTQRAVTKYGVTVCLEAFRMNERGEGARTIGFEFKLTTNQADAAINAGREVSNAAKAANGKDKYFALQADLQVIEEKTGVYLADQCVDRENVFEGKSLEDLAAFNGNYLRADSPLWVELIRAAGMAAGMRAEDAGLDINALIGRTIY